MPGHFLPLSAREERAWEAYEATFGPLDAGERLEGYLAHIHRALVALIPREEALPGVKEFLVEWDQGIGVPEPEVPDGAPPWIRGFTAALGGEDRRPGQADL